MQKSNNPYHVKDLDEVDMEKQLDDFMKIFYSQYYDMYNLHHMIIIRIIIIHHRKVIVAEVRKNQNLVRK